MQEDESLEKDDRVERFAGLVHDVAAYSAALAKRENLSVEEACQLTANTTMLLLDGGWCYAPRFELTPVPYDPKLPVRGKHLADRPAQLKKICEDQDFAYELSQERKSENTVGWDYGTQLKRPAVVDVQKPDSVLVNRSREGMLSNVHGKVYDDNRDRYTLSAADLFD